MAEGQRSTSLAIDRMIRQKTANLAFDDYVTIPQALVDAGHLGREKDGSRYWRIEKNDE